jgi:hypothetical protein
MLLKIALGGGNLFGQQGVTLETIFSYVQSSWADLRESVFVDNLVRELEAVTPTTRVEFLALVVRARVVPGAAPVGGGAALAPAFGGARICLEGPNETCTDIACAPRGDCEWLSAIWQPFFEFDCECFLRPEWRDVVLIALLILLAAAIPGPADDVAAWALALKRFLIKQGPRLPKLVPALAP